MAERIKYQVPPTRTEPTAREEMDELLENLHQHGFLRLANGLVKSNNEVGKILVSGLNQPGTQNALQNLSLLMMTLGSVPPERFNHLLLAVRDAAMAVKPARDEARQEKAAPGIRGIIRLLNDEDLWRGLRPVFAALEVFSQQIDREEEKPITRFSGKPSRE
ncbi:Uncharacterized conserved protein YjgD, DUF1641 family [Candidatus Pantoea varia]|uniref:Uncharacterized conserved protein YjgD, DUF1641 family n=1 Tax=Candidatus Pantoea varia TaxID=1881036 RepID=A0A1I5F4S5_9GAMM|nr:DUF1641 domain-containing protein [Pantoea varia]SFO18798.1 Uncharacterized conserved protein YjgD, DUF1641 family [Pantoea varia]